MKKPTARNTAAREWAFQTIPIAREIAERFDGSFHWSQGILADARKEIARRDPKRLEEHNERIRLAFESVRAGERDPERLSRNIGITLGQAENVVNRKVNRLPGAKNLNLSNIDLAREYAANNEVTGYRLRKMFGLTQETARRIANEANANSPKRAEVVNENRKKALTYAYSLNGKITPRELSDMFGFGQAKARGIIVDVLADIRRMEAVTKPKPTRIVRRFRDLSGTDATADERRYPSGIGFGVVEVVR